MKVLVAGAGNIFLGDDGFGVAVLQRLAQHEFPDNVRLMDVGIRGVHLAYELLDGYDVLVLIDAVAHDEAPGTVSTFERVWEDGEPGVGSRGRDDGAADPPSAVADAHDLSPDSVLSLVASLGGRVDRIFTVGCQPARLAEQMGLSEPVEAAVEPAAKAVRRLVQDLLRSEPGSSRATGSERIEAQENTR